MVGFTKRPQLKLEINNVIENEFRKDMKKMKHLLEKQRDEAEEKRKEKQEKEKGNQRKRNQRKKQERKEKQKERREALQ